MNSKDKAQEILALGGITINGVHPFDIQVHDERLYDRVFSGGTLAFGEAYMDGWWDVEKLDDFFYRILKVHLDKKVKPFSLFFHSLKSKIINLQSRGRAVQVAEEHYDLGNDLYRHMLDERTMSYTCGYWKDGVTTLDDAQEAKIDLLCKKIGLKKGDHVLDIGCGFGGFAKHAAEKYGARVTGVSLSKEQIRIAKERTRELPVEIRFEDYRDVQGKFDHVVSIEMIEAVGYKNFRTYFEKAHSVLKEGGFFGLQMIGSDKSTTTNEPWYEKYIFKNGMLPSIKQLGESVENLFVIEDCHNFSAYYDLTLMSWFKNFDSAWPELKAKYSKRFYRMWKYYLLQTAGSFRSRNIQLYQVVLSKGGMEGGYQSFR